MQDNLDKVCATDDILLQCDSLVSMNMLLQDLKCFLTQQSRTSRLLFKMNISVFCSIDDIIMYVYDNYTI